MLGMMASSPVWWFYIFWVPDFLNKRFGLGLTQSSLPLIVIFVAASFGGIFGGWLSSALLKRGWTVNAARKTALLVCALCVVPVFATPLVPVAHVWWAVALVALAAAAHCGYAANLFTLVSDTVPRQAVSSVVGIGGMAGSIAGMAFAQVVARVLLCDEQQLRRAVRDRGHDVLRGAAPHPSAPAEAGADERSGSGHARVSGRF